LALPNELRITKATEQDVPLILSFIRQLAEYEKLLDKTEVNEERIRRTIFGRPPFAHVLLAYADEVPVGFAVYFFNYSTFIGLPGLYLEDIFVKPEWRGKGVGLAIFKYLGRITLENGCHRMDWAVLNWNESAIDFYRKLGAEAQHDWSNYRLSGPALARLAE
jgi:GNAT superfamily N-acetyltransferase